MTLHEQWVALVAYAHQHGLTVKLVPCEQVHDYAAMNPEAGKVMGVPISKNEIWIDRSLSKAEQVRDLRHELVEINLMKEGKKYWDAHCLALKREAQNCRRLR